MVPVGGIHTIPIRTIFSYGCITESGGGENGADEIGLGPQQEGKVFSGQFPETINYTNRNSRVHRCATP